MKFTKMNTMNVGGSGLTVAELLGFEDSQENQAAFLGRCMTLFGEPNETSENHEELYSYYIKAEDENGEEAELEVYFGSGGPSVCFRDSFFERRAAKELAGQIMAAEPKDHKIESIYEDVPVKIIMGVENGKPFYNSLLPGTEDMSPEEQMQAMEEMFDL